MHNWLYFLVNGRVADVHYWKICHYRLIIISKQHNWQDVKNNANDAEQGKDKSASEARIHCRQPAHACMLSFARQKNSSQFYISYKFKFILFQDVWIVKHIFLKKYFIHFLQNLHQNSNSFMLILFPNSTNCKDLACPIGGVVRVRCATPSHAISCQSLYCTYDCSSLNLSPPQTSILTRLVEAWGSTV